MTYIVGKFKSNFIEWYSLDKKGKEKKNNFHKENNKVNFKLPKLDSYCNDKNINNSNNGSNNITNI